MNNSDFWGTADEIRFLLSTESKTMPKLQFLLNYKEAIKCRTNWENIKKGEVCKILEHEIKRLQQGE